MRNRRVVALGLLALLAVGSGCSTLLGPSPVDRGALTNDADYAWNASANGYLDVGRTNYTAVYEVGNRTTGNLAKSNPTIEVYTRDALGTERPLSVSAVKFSYPNGTIVEFRKRGGTVSAVTVFPNGTTRPAGDALTVEKTRKRTIIGLPANATGQIAFTAPKNGKSVATPTFVTGDYEMVLPARAEVGIPILAQVRPRADRTFTDRAGRVHIQWNEVQSRSLSVRYYLGRDLLIFAALVGGLTITGIVGATYYLLEIRKTRKKREEVGLDVDVTDDDRGPPPGMR